MKRPDMQSFFEAGSKMPPQKDQPSSCTLCQGISFKPRLKTYPVTLTQPKKLAGKLVEVYRVALHECQSCGNLMPTPAGLAKIERCVKRGIQYLLGTLR
jgi:hypothetical protein